MGEMTLSVESCAANATESKHVEAQEERRVGKLILQIYQLCNNIYYFLQRYRKERLNSFCIGH